MQPDRFRLELLGAFRLFAPDGSRVQIPSKRSRVLLAMLSSARSGERSRQWLEDHLWGSRGKGPAQASLRRELSNLRSLLNLIDGDPLLRVNRDAVALDLRRVQIDIHDGSGGTRGDFLEGIDLAGEEGFEDWLREERQTLAESRNRRQGEPTGAGSGEPINPFFTGQPSIAVLLQQQDLCPADAALIEGLADDLADRLARLRWLPLVGAPIGTLQIESNASVSRAGKLLNVAYVLHCRLSLGRSFTLTLSETESGRLLWSRRYELQAPVAASDVERAATDAIAALSMQIETDQQRRVRDRQVQAMTPDELLWRARWHMRRLTREDARQAEVLLAMAALARPDSAEVLIEQGYAQAWKLWAAGADQALIEGLRQRVARVRDLDPHDARGHLLLGILNLWLSRHESAEALMREALLLNPSLSSAYGQLGSCLSLAGRPEEGLGLLQTALKLNPLDTQNFHQFGEMALAHLMLGDLRAAVAQADQALARRPAYLYGHVLKATALQLGGETKGWLEARAALRQLKPDYDPSALEWLPFKDRAWNRKIRQAVDDTGAPARRSKSLSAC